MVTGPTSSHCRTFIHGSCVSRDTFGFLPDTFVLAYYVARQSIISVDRPVAGIASRLKPLTSAFQDRAVRGDLAGDALNRLRGRSEQVDLVLMDLTDERGGVLEIGNGYASKLAEFWGNGGRELARGARHIPFGSDEHFSLWAEAWNRYEARVAELGLQDRLVMLHTPWAALLDDGSALEVPRWMLNPALANQLHERYVAHVAKGGVSIVELPEGLVRSSADHRWGASPFHYTDAAYEHLAARISRIARRVRAVD